MDRVIFRRLALILLADYLGIALSAIVYHWNDGLSIHDIARLFQPSIFIAITSLGFYASRIAFLATVAIGTGYVLIHERPWWSWFAPLLAFIFLGYTTILSFRTG